MDQDYFGKQAQNYKLNRTAYHPSLIEKIKSKLDSLGAKSQRMLDIATGSGQLAIALAQNFIQVIGLDISAKQIEEASQRKDKPSNVKFDVFDCSQIQKYSDLNQISNYDLITCGQCLHWFEPHKILSQIKKTLNQQAGLLVVLSYVKFNYQANNSKGQELISILQEQREKIWPYFTFQNQEMLGYPSYPFHQYFENVEKQIVKIELDISIDQVTKHMCTWSAVQNYNIKQNQNFQIELKEAIRACLGEENQIKLLEPSYFCKVSMDYSLIFAY